MRDGRITGRRALVLGVFVGALALLAGSAPAQDSSYQLLVSSASDRSSPLALGGETVAGEIYVFVGPESGIKQVRFYLDNPTRSGTPRQVEKRAPWDFAGTNPNGSAAPLDTTSIADGSHEITAAIDRTDGTSEVLSAVFTVGNGSSPSLVFNPSSLSFSSDEGGTSSSKTTDLATSDGSAASFTVSDDAAWLSATPTSGTTPAALTITANPAGLASGIYSGSVTATALGHGPASLSVTLTVKSQTSYQLLLSKSPDRSSAIGLAGTTVEGDIHVFTLPDAGVKQVRFYLDNPTMSGTPRQVEKGAPYDFAGTKPDGTAKPFNTTAVAEGGHEITAAIDRTDGTTDVVSGGFTVKNVKPALAFDTASLGFSAEGGGSASSQTTRLTASDGSAASFTATDDAGGGGADWLTVTPVSGTTPATLTVTADPSGLAAGKYSATVKASADGYAAGSLKIDLTVTDPNACGTLSPLPCSEVLVGFPYELDFSSGHGQILDGTGTGTGFTVVDPPTNGTGYVPAKLAVDATTPGTLKITTTAGLASEAANSQDNALGVGIDASDHVSLLTTTLRNPPAGSGKFEQAGLWFGNDEDNYAKLIVRSAPGETDIQFFVEVNGARSNARDTGALDLTGAAVTLSLRADPSTQKVAAFYSINGGDRIQIASVPVPGEFFSADGARIDPTIGTDTFGGIFASHRNGSASLTYVFDDFTLVDDTPPSSTSNLPFTRSSFALTRPTAMVFGPDGRLYVTELQGKIHALTLDANKQPIADEVITTLGLRLTLGIAIDPASTPENVILWVTHSDKDLTNNAPANSSVVSRLSGPGFTTKQDVITGLPRSKANHSINAVHFGPDGKLYIAQSGNTGAGAPNTAVTEFGDRPEQPLSSAILVADVKASGFQGSCATPIGTFGIPSTCDVRPYATGFRNAYDFVWHSNGSMYAPDNGVGVTSTFPPSPTPPCTGLGDTTSWQQGGDNPGDQPDLLFRVQQGMYHGHPNPYRNECVFKDGSYQGVSPLPSYVPPIASMGMKTSSNGTIEYRGSAFGGALRGNLVIANFSQGDNLVRVVLSDDGASVVKMETLASGFADPLPLTEGPDGTIYVGEFGAGKITALIPGNVGSWTTKAPLPLDLLDGGGTALGGKLYVVAGKTSAGPRRSMYVYDPATDSWSEGPSLPTEYPAVENPAVAASGGKLYVFGGSSEPFSGSVTSAAVFNPTTQAWTMLASMATARGGPTAQAVGTKLYVAGGLGADGASLASVEVFDPATGSWSSATPMTTRRDNPGSAVLNGKLYVFGGRIRDASGTTVNGTLTSVEMYDAATDTWVARAPMPTGRRTMVVGTLNGRAQVMGGEKSNTTSGTFEQNEEYDPLTDAWETLAPMPTPRHGAVAGTINGVVYVVGGGPSSGPSFSRVNEAFSR